MKLENLLFTTAMPFLLGCGDLPTEPKLTTLLRLDDYTCADEACNAVGRKLNPRDETRPLRFISVASYPGVQNYHWDLTWKEAVPYGDIDFIVDDTILKQGRFTPGVHIPVKSWEAIRPDNRQNFVLLSWNYKDSILQKLKSVASSGKVIVPFPSLGVESFG